MTSVSTDRRHGVNAGAAIKVPCRAASIINLVLEGEQTVDGVALVADDRILVTGQTDGSENGIYVVDTGTWARGIDWDGTFDVVTGTEIRVTAGTSNAGEWYINTTGTITIGTTSVAFTQLTEITATITAFSETLLDDADAGAWLTTLGFSPFVQTLVDDTSAAIFLTTLGVSAYIQTLLDDADAATARATLGIFTTEDIALSGGVIVTSKDLGTVAAGTVTPDPGDRPLQHYINGGAHTLAPSANVGSALVDVTNNAAAGAVTTSGFDKVTGDALDTTDGNKFRCSITIGDAGSLLIVRAMQ